jgi:hypothetical protein
VRRGRLLGLAVLASIPVGDLAAAAAGRSQVTIGVPGVVQGDGRTALEPELGEPPPPSRAENRELPAAPRLDCAGAATLPAAKAAGPAVLLPAAPEATRLSCSATWRGATSVFEVAVEPPGPGLYGAASPPAVTAGDPPVTLDTFVVDQEGRVAPPARLRAAASAGRLTVSGASASLALPSGRAPHSLAVALTDGERLGAVFVPMAGRVTLPVETQSGATIEVRLGGRTVGPIVAQRGSVDVPLEVPPGVDRAVVRATDRLGNVGETVVDLAPPDRPRLAAVLPSETVDARSTVSVAVALSTRGGRPAVGARIVGQARHGEVRDAIRRGAGLWELPYVAPAEAADDEITVSVDRDPGAGSVTLALAVLSGGPAPAESSRTIHREPPPRAVRLGLFARAGWTHNGHTVSALQLAAGAQVARALWALEVSASVGVEHTYFSDSPTVDLKGGGTVTVDRSLSLIGFPVMVRAGYRLSESVVASLGLGVAPLVATGTVSPSFQARERETSFALAYRGELCAHVPLGPGDLVATARVSSARVDAGPIEGDVERYLLGIGYDVWLGAFGG